MEDKDLYKKALEAITKVFIFIAPILIGFGGSIAYNGLKRIITKKEFFIHLILSITVSVAVYDVVQNFATLKPYAGVIIGVSSFFSIQIIEILIKNFPQILKTILKIFLTQLDEKQNLKDKKDDVND